MSTSGDLDRAERILWDYLRLGQVPRPAETILALGSMDIRVAERAAALYLAGYAPYLVVSGGFGRLTGLLFDRPEAEVFAEIARRAGVPSEAIGIESQSTNTAENIAYTAAFVQDQGRTLRSVLLVTQPPLERRALATFRHYWPDPDTMASVTSPEIDRAGYPAPGQSRDHLRAMLAGEVRRLRVYPERGWLGAQEIPEAVWQASEHVLAAGYDAFAVPLGPPGNAGATGDSR
jgi:uncharacterized SAM-binding protein YcdF (DUF218 family)